MISVPEPLIRYFDGSKGKCADRFFSIFAEFERIQRTFWGLIDLANPFHHVYLSPTIEPILGYPQSTFYSSQNFEFMSSITPLSHLPMISARQAQYVKEALEPGFDFVAPQLMDFHSAFICADGREMAITYNAVVLDYTASGVMKTLVGVYWDVANKEESKLEDEVGNVRQLLRELKKTYVEMFPERFSQIRTNQTPLVQIYFPVERPEKELTPKELTILKLLGQGFTAKEISQQQGISFNTVETHRKHLLEKFNASNVAELMSKASKLYWLE